MFYSTLRKLMVAALISPVLLSLAEFPHAHARDKLPPYVLDSKAASADEIGIYWMDNHRVLFRHLTRPRWLIFNNIRYWRHHIPITIWDTRTGKVTEIAETERQDYCYNARDQILTYRIDPVPEALGDDSPARYMTGPVGNLKEVVPKRDFPGHEYSPWRCTWVKLPKHLKGHRAYILHKGHGFIDHGKPGVVLPNFIYYAAGSKKKIDVPFVFIDEEFYSFKGAYYVSGYLERKKDKSLNEIPTKTWWFYPGGKLEEVKLPSFAFGDYPMRHGFIMRPFSKFVDLTAKHGLYYFENGKLRPLILGTSLDVAVSPDGCKFAFTHRFDDSKKLETTLKMIDICKHRDVILAIKPVAPPAANPGGP